MTPPASSVSPSSFLSPTFDPGDLAQIKERCLALESRPLHDAATTERFLLDESELLARVASEAARRYIAMTCHTDRPEARERYLAFEREVSPQLKVLCDRLDRHLLDSEGARRLDAARYALLLKKR